MYHIVLMFLRAITDRYICSELPAFSPYIGLSKGVSCCVTRLWAIENQISFGFVWSRYLQNAVAEFDKHVVFHKLFCTNSSHLWYFKMFK